MKKVIFLAIAAAAALTACSKSEVIDSKYGNDMIGFETYLGRDAQTKATVANETNLVDLGLYGFYTGAQNWSETTAPNLWTNAQLTSPNWAPTEVKYWTNATDKYTFLAYAPFASETNGLVASTEANPTVEYTVPGTLDKQSDVLYANTPAVDGANGHVNMVKPENGTVTLNLKHALARLTVKASAPNGEDSTPSVFKFDVKEVTITGKFITKDVLTLATGAWTKGGTPATDNTTYLFHRNGNVAEDGSISYGTYSDANALNATAVDYAGENKDNYLMMIPTNFSGTDAAATLTVKYTTYYENQESTVNTATFNVTTNFEQGKAYAINLTFTKDVEPIKFNVTVEDWKESTTEGDTTDDHQQNEEIQA